MVHEAFKSFRAGWVKFKGPAFKGPAFKGPALRGPQGKQ